jgi:hypothetical protein
MPFYPLSAGKNCVMRLTKLDRNNLITIANNIIPKIISNTTTSNTYDTAMVNKDEQIPITTLPPQKNNSKTTNEIYFLLFRHK